jgi:hypothetical protein
MLFFLMAVFAMEGLVDFVVHQLLREIPRWSRHEWGGFAPIRIRALLGV